ncbi:uncharacterized protein BKA55DRAFT_689356 [Fusarium redolens]|uniref:Myb-like domain-containing protein n=1 Tax=Fusarium redolens TaxID=48865 RepID=A0A9P9HA49_FUSRE|nr:uncharacterized protein BKA55DRAFT_689356 [Fusarium redolens]KAH7253855.1 hypothetical protein BKA55DRAFT_689356 [Fusarium redolens]
MTESSENTPDCFRPWQRRALENGRTPLPENPGERPWLNTSSDTETATSSVTVPPASFTFISQRNASTLEVQASPDTVGVAQNYRWWTEGEKRRLIHLRNSGQTWAAISSAFPDRTLQALKQTYHKRRFAIERQMEKEAAAATSADTCLINEDGKKSNS